MKEEDLISSLKQINNVLKNDKIDYWLDAGTLLGAVREKRFLPWDYDIDIGAWYQDIDIILKSIKKLETDGFEIVYFPLEKCIKILGNNSEIDLNLYEKTKDQATRVWFVNNKTGKILDYIRWMLVIKNPTFKRSKVPKIISKIIHLKTKILSDKSKKKLLARIEKKYQKSGCRIVSVSIPAKYFAELDFLKFYKIDVKAPKNPEKYLEFRYGSNWQTPKKDYVYYEDDQSIIGK